MSYELTIRFAHPSDAGRLLEIYAPYVEHTAITFEYDVPSPAEFTRRIEAVQARYPYIVAIINGQIAGYAYASAFHPRAAYDHSAEISIYVEQGMRKTGIGRRLYTAIETLLKAMNILNVNACIGYPTVDDEFLTKNSVQFHEHMGYRMVGEFHNCGYKFGRWYNMVWMEKMLGEHGDNPAPVININDIDISSFDL